jgi:uncharacterized linocin/CFP29 family protein
MNVNLGRDRLWNEHIWSEIDRAVREEVGRIRVAQKVFPATVVNNVLPVSTSRSVPFGALAPVFPVTDQFQPFFEISTEFVLTQAQVDAEENARLAPSFARQAASVIADAEDTILFLGPGPIPRLVAAGVGVTNQPAAIPPGFVAEAAAYPPVNVRGATPLGTPPPTSVGDIIGAVAQGMANLNTRAQPGPYALFLSPERYAQTFAPNSAGQLETPGDQINHVVTGGFYMVSCLAVPPQPPAPPPDVGILVSLGGVPAEIILGTDPMIAFTFTDVPGNYHFRVFERIQMVVRDGRAFQTLQFPLQSAQSVSPRRTK